MINDEIKNVSFHKGCQGYALFRPADNIYEEMNQKKGMQGKAYTQQLTFSTGSRPHKTHLETNHIALKTASSLSKE